MNFYMVCLGALCLITISLPLTADEAKPISPCQSIVSSKKFTIANTITDEMITYRGARAPFPISPSTFKVSVNDQELKRKCKQLVETHEGTIKIKYEWEKKQLGIVYHREEKEIVFTPNPDVSELNLNFSFDEEQRLTLNEYLIASTENKQSIIDIQNKQLADDNKKSITEKKNASHLSTEKVTP